MVTCSPIGVSKDAPITEEMREQIDYIMTNSAAATITDCETDTNMNIDTDHYPMIGKS